MNEEEILRQAKIDVSNFVDEALEELHSLAYKYHYEFSWVCAEFKKQLNERVKDDA